MRRTRRRGPSRRRLRAAPPPPLLLPPPPTTTTTTRRPGSQLAHGPGQARRSRRWTPGECDGNGGVAGFRRRPSVAGGGFGDGGRRLEVNRHLSYRDNGNLKFKSSPSRCVPATHIQAVKQKMVMGFVTSPPMTLRRIGNSATRSLPLLSQKLPRLPACARLTAGLDPGTQTPGTNTMVSRWT